MDAQVETFYRQIYADRNVSPEEAGALVEYFTALNPPPDKLVWLRLTAFRLGCEFLSDEGDHDQNVAILRAITALIHSLETTCMVPKVPEGKAEYDAEKTEAFFKDVFSDLSVDHEEKAGLQAFFQANIPPQDSLVTMRNAAFKSAVDSLSADREANVALLRCINVVVHNFEMACFLPKEYHLKKTFNLDVGLSDAVQEMWNLDVNRLTPNADYTINVQEGKKPYWKGDHADEPLFTRVDRQALQRPTYRTFIALLDNYKSHTGQAEQVTSQERREMDAFLKAILQTAPMQYCHQYLLANCKHTDIPSDLGEFQKLLYKIWFEMYRRGGREKDSSGFEHVFVGEVKDGKVSGMHNWVQLYLEEKKGELDYRGYVVPKSRSQAETNSDDHLLSLQFAWNGVEKFVGTSFLGVSPEFEVAVYTTCFLMGEEENDITLDTGTGDVFDLKIRCYKMARDKIGTAFPEATAHYD
uniref:EndoU domain-containing protein n=2 Tax=Chromera velia CCMP2878 TaxID=1169474 RepID=A0A0K6SAD4_9ALVE|eukprot:Cvel_1676.t1-p1 / transcript=Cvel_1676.t1 / gene=Cvel_1676 / organism=Chromera_velia_CCMP2878 / gene_product=Poly(U)-specific endoribonuclease-B, putative / transcript_product=Poly(U)-specific endoribonuclease-B, putative / location=Cvel_scaffold60:70265-71668(-) / protein_length=468 / sequence_SO=supercontig / SO=protein_coding / is_pseudo=false